MLMLEYLGRDKEDIEILFPNTRFHGGDYNQQLKKELK